MTVHLESFFRQDTENEKKLITQFYAIKTGLGVDKFLALYYFGIVAHRALLKSAASLREQKRCFTIADSVYDEIQWSGGMPTISGVHDFQRKTRSSSAVQAAITEHIMRNIRAYLNRAIRSMTDPQDLESALACCNWMHERARALHFQFFSEDTQRAYNFENGMYKGSDTLTLYARMPCDNLHLLAGMCLLSSAFSKNSYTNNFLRNASDALSDKLLKYPHFVRNLEEAIFNKVYLTELKEWMSTQGISNFPKAVAPSVVETAPSEPAVPPKKRVKKAAAVKTAVVSSPVTEAVESTEAQVAEQPATTQATLTGAQVAEKVAAVTDSGVRQETATLTCSLTLTVVELNGMYSVDVNPGSVQAAVQPEKFSTPGVSTELSLAPLAARVTEYLSKRYLPDLAKSLSAEYNQAAAKELKAAKLRKAQEELQAEVAKLSPEAQELFNRMKKSYRG